MSRGASGARRSSCLFTNSGVADADIFETVTADIDNHAGC